MLPLRRKLDFHVVGVDAGCVFIDGAAKLEEIVNFVQTAYPGFRLIYGDADRGWREITVTADNTLGFFPYFGWCPELTESHASK